MRLLNLVLVMACITTMFVPQKGAAKPKIVPQIYVFGFSASFNDSTIYITDIQTIDSAVIDSKTKFLANRADYAYQMNSYFDNKGQKHRTCVLFYDLSRKKLLKKFDRIKKKSSDDKMLSVVNINSSDFTFKHIIPESANTGKEE